LESSKSGDFAQRGNIPKSKDQLKTKKNSFLWEGEGGFDRGEEERGLNLGKPFIKMG
jgi:hypothetical protein